MMNEILQKLVQLGYLDLISEERINILKQNVIPKIADSSLMMGYFEIEKYKSVAQENLLKSITEYSNLFSYNSLCAEMPLNELCAPKQLYTSLDFRYWHADSENLAEGDAEEFIKGLTVLKLINDQDINKNELSVIGNGLSWESAFKAYGLIVQKALSVKFPELVVFGYEVGNSTSLVLLTKEQAEYINSTVLANKQKLYNI